MAILDRPITLDFVEQSTLAKIAVKLAHHMAQHDVDDAKLSELTGVARAVINMILMAELDDVPLSTVARLLYAVGAELTVELTDL